MKVSYSEGLANHAGSESCGVAREGGAEALTGEGAGRVFSRENTILRDADAVRRGGRQHCVCRYCEAHTSPAWSQIAIRSGGCAPDSAQIGAKSAEFILTFLGDSTRLLLHAPHELCFGRGKIAQTFFPLCLKPTSYESVFRLDRAILALCTFR